MQAPTEYGIQRWLSSAEHGHPERLRRLHPSRIGRQATVDIADQGFGHSTLPIDFARDTKSAKIGAMKESEPTREQLIEALREANQRLMEIEERLRASQDDAEWLEQAIRKRTRDLTERVKELNCLYQITVLLEESDKSITESIQSLVEVVPQAWQYPELAYARAVLGKKEFKTKNFQETPWRQTCDIFIRRRRVGRFEVGYISAPSRRARPIFFPEEGRLLQDVCRRLGWLLEFVSYDP